MNFTQFVLVLIATFLFGIMFDLHCFISWIIDNISFFGEDDGDK